MAVTGVSDVSSTIQKIVSEITTKTLIQEAVSLAMPGIWDRSSEVGPGMDRLDMIELAELAVQAVDETGAALTPTSISPTARQLDLDQHKGIFFSLTKRGDLQSKIRLVQRTIENGARSLAADVDDYNFSVAVAAAGSTVTAAAADQLAAIRALMKSFDDANVPISGRSLVAGNEFFQDLLGNNNVIRANEFGSSEPIRAASVVDLYGFQVFRSSSSNVPVDGFIGMGLEAMAFARQRMMELEEQNQVLNQKKDYSLVHLFGAESTAASNPRIYVYDPV